MEHFGIRTGNPAADWMINAVFFGKGNKGYFDNRSVAFVESELFQQIQQSSNKYMAADFRILVDKVHWNSNFEV